MDYNTFVLAMSDIANQLYSKPTGDAEEIARGEAQAFAALMELHLAPLDEGI